MSEQPYAPPAVHRDARPVAIRLFRVYAATMAVGSLAMLGALAAFGAGALAGTSVSPALIGSLAALHAAVFGAAAFVPYKPWGWTLALLALAVGVGSTTFFLALPLLFAWFTPRVKAAFARL